VGKLSELMRSIGPMAGLGLMLWLAGCSPAPEAAKQSADSSVSVSVSVSASAPALASPGLSEAQKAEILKALPAPYNVADMLNGQKQFNKCRSCHTLYEGEMALIGPNLYTVFGRKSGSYPGYTFSEAMRGHNVVWDYDTLNDYLAAPQVVVKGTKMGFMGLKSETDRRDLIAYIRVETSKAP
jgi:cytochrome c